MRNRGVEVHCSLTSRQPTDLVSLALQAWEGCRGLPQVMWP